MRISANFCWVLVGLQVLGPLAASAQSTPFPDFQDRPGRGPPIDYSYARNEGYSDGLPDGEREGRDRARLDGFHSGQVRGYRAGYDRCLADRRQSAYDQGYLYGHQQGSIQGSSEGQIEGNRQGQINGQEDGRRDGEQRAESSARTESEAPARAQGQAEAERTDSMERGAAAGQAAGEARARKAAVEKDFAAGRQSHRQERFAEPIRTEKNEDLTERSSALAIGAEPSALMEAGALHSDIFALSWPDFRYRRERPRRSEPGYIDAYRQGYRQGYTDGYRRVYSVEYNFSENLGFSQGREQGCREAQHANVRADQDRGYRDGHSQGYRSSYRQSYDLAFRAVYDQVFGPASQAQFSARYPVFYEQFFAQFKSEAFRDRVDSLYREGFDREEKSAYERNYPIYARQEFERGVQEEAREFLQRPIRAVQFSVREQLADLIYEPEERIDFSFKFRNFSDQEIAASEVKIQVSVSGVGAVVLRTADQGRSSVPARGALTIAGAVPIRLLEQGLGKITQVTVRAFFRGELIDSKLVELAVKNRAVLEWAEAPSLREGLMAPIRFRVSNQSAQEIVGPLTVNLKSNAGQIELVDSAQQMAALRPGETREVVFKVIARSPASSVDLPLAVVITDGASKRVLARDFSRAAPVLNDYRIQLSEIRGDLKSSGVARLSYVLRNVSSRLLFSALELHARVMDSSGTQRSDVQWIGFNPQYLLPVDRGRSVAFTIPVLMTSASRGTLELEVRENGVPVVIHRVEF